MTRWSGAAKIARFNWPWYAAALASGVALTFVLRSGALPAPWDGLVLFALVADTAWVLASLAVSHHVYDRSPVARGEWLEGLEPPPARRIGIFHAGQDEAGAAVARRLPEADVQAFDFHDPALTPSASLARARALAPQSARAIAIGALPLEAGALDLALLVFAAHELRSAEDRAALFREVGRVLAPDGRLLVVEHLRDAWNALAFGPGALHFLARATWERTFREAGLRIVRDVPCSRFVRVFELRSRLSG